MSSEEYQHSPALTLSIFAAGKERLQQKEAREADIASALKAHNEVVHLRGETLPEQQQIIRVKVISCFLRAAFPLSKVLGLFSKRQPFALQRDGI